MDAVMLDAHSETPEDGNGAELKWECGVFPGSHFIHGK